MSSRMDLMDLARHLRQEALFVSSEKQSLQHLNEKVIKAAENLYHLSWVARQQRLTLDNLLLSHTDSHLASSCNRSNLLETVNFIDSYKQLGIHDNSYSEFLQQFRENPKLIASCLNNGEKIDITTMHSVVNIIMAAIYGNCILPEDEVHALTLLRELMSLQLAVSDNPRRLLRHGSCAFSRVYKIFSECLFSAKIFLTAALHEPIMHLLMADDLFLDIDPSKAAVRFQPQERLRHFGKEGTPEYTASLQRYRNWTINKLVNITNRFIEEIRNNLYCFPQSLSWLARQMYNIVMKAKRVEVREVGAMCADLVFAFFICPAIVDPESYGITDIPISYIARFNLMQVAQILQVLAMSKWEEIDPKLMDLYGKFEKDSMSSLLDLILEGSSSDSPADLVTQFQDLNRSAVLITESELMSLVSFLRSVEAASSDPVLKKTLYAMINHLPAMHPNVPPTLQNGNANVPSSFSNSSDNQSHLPSSKRGFLGKVSRRSSKLPSNLLMNSDNTADEANGVQEGDINMNSKTQLEDVLVVPIQGIDFDCPGMLNEDKVLAIESQKKKQSLENGSLISEDGDTLNVGPEIIEKRTRFSLSQDQESLGTSDNLEAISEAASNHSVASSIDLENENDNLSDMVSANVSGRGTPNVSGRDTPSSQLEDEGREQRPLDLTAPVRNQSQQENIEDKFGKFEIQPMMEGDETKSIVSDTWSTDVLASDSETVEQSDISCHVTLESQSCLERSLLDTSETASQSDAWSTDVLASDTERLQDVDTDDTASVARSDDTARSEVDSEVAQNLDDNPLDRKDVTQSDNMRDPFLPDQYGAMGDNQAFSHLSSSSENYSSMKQNFCSFPAFNDDQSLFNDGDMKSGEKLSHGSESLPLKVPDLLCMDIENNIDVPPIVPNSSQLSHEESLSSMQSLGRVSLAVRELPDADQDSGIMLLDSLQETVNMQNAQQAHRSSIVDILSLDLTRTLNLPASNCPSENLLQKSESGGSLKDFEMEIYGSKMQQESSGNSDFAKPTSTPRCSVIERGAKRKLLDFGAEDVCPQFRAVTLSNSVGNIESSSQFGNDHLESHNARHAKANSVPLSVGAIPKTMNYHKNIEEMDQDMDDKSGGDKHRRGLFKLSGFRFTFKGRNRKSHPGFRSDGEKDSFHEADGRASNRQSQSSFAEMRALQLEAGDEILAKYRKKSPVISSNSALKASSSELSETMSNASDNVLIDGPQVFDPLNTENSGIFFDAKRKLRLVLGSADLQTLPWLNHSRNRSASGALQRLQENELVAFLKVLLAEAINLQQRPLMAHLHEALRCVRLFDDVGCQKLFKSLRDDYRKRAPYIAYLVRCRQGLLSTLSHLDTLTERVDRDKQVCSLYLIMTCTKIFLEKHDRYLQYFVRKFQDLVAADEKATLVENFLSLLFNRMQNDQIWLSATDCQIEHAKAVIEHSVMSQIYTSAIHPNGDGDVLRDKVLHEHMQKLSQVITPNHKDLSIPKVYHSECPWPSAQAELVNINAYKTPRDKIQCVLRCCSTIMNLLSIASDKSVPAADDLMPVLVFVLIKANPPHLLSTVQYVNTFYEKQLEGEEAYWWTQFASAVEFIKNMDY